MDPEVLQPGDLVYARTNIHSDGYVPGHDTDTLLAPAGRAGMVIRIGHAEYAPSETILLVRFRDEGGQLGQPLGCIPEELTQDPD